MPLPSADVSSPSLPDVGNLVGDYVLEHIISEGGMGRVYRARHRRLGRQVALKMLLSSASADSPEARRFFAEARAVNRIRHEHLIEVTDFAEARDGPAYYIMELLVGRSLREILVGARVPLKRCMHIWLQLADVLAVLHEDCVVHRDLKPENVFLIARDGVQDYVKLIDFGTARLLDEEGAQILPNETPGVVLGTPHYMAPEQADGRDVDDLADVYAFGVIMYEMISGRHPHDADDPHELIMLKRTVAPTPVAEVSGGGEQISSELNELVMQCLALKPADRPQSMQEVRLRLMLLETLEVKAEGAAVPRPDGDEPTVLAKRRQRRMLQRNGAIGAGVIALIAIIIVSVRSLSDPPPPPPPPVVVAAPLAHVLISSLPDGAAVYERGGPAPLGQTPFTYAVPADAGPHVLVFKLAGYDDVERAIDATTGETMQVTLSKRVKVADGPQKRKVSQHKLKRGGFMDPFK